MGTNFEKTKELLMNDKSKAGVAVKALAMDLDNKFAELDKKNDERHEAILLAIKNSKAQTDKEIDGLKKSTDERFEKIKPIMVIADNWKLIIGIILIVLIAIGLIRADEIKEWFKILK